VRNPVKREDGGARYRNIRKPNRKSLKKELLEYFGETFAELSEINVVGTWKGGGLRKKLKSTRRGRGPFRGRPKAELYRRLVPGGVARRRVVNTAFFDLRRGGGGSTLLEQWRVHERDSFRVRSLRQMSKETEND